MFTPQQILPRRIQPSACRCYGRYLASTEAPISNCKVQSRGLCGYTTAFVVNDFRVAT